MTKASPRRGSLSPRRRPGPKLTIQRASRAAHIPTDAKLKRFLHAALRRNATITLRIVAATEGQRLNREFRGKNYATNVLTFVYGDAPLTGDIVLCAPVVAREAKEQGKDVAAHYAHLVVHGALHLQGLDHEAERSATRMEREERRVLRTLGFPDPYA